MTPSARYRNLVRAVNQLRSSLLPRKFDDAGHYRNPTRVHLQAASFRFLVHAEIESYIEDRAGSLFDAGWKLWSQKRRPSIVIVSLLALDGREHSSAERLAGKPGSKVSLGDVVAREVHFAQNVWLHEHRKNNGIKEENINRLLLPLGLDLSALDPLLIPELNSYGSTRGEIAHRSSVSARTKLDPSDELVKAKNLLLLLKTLDEAVNRAIAEVGS